MDLNIEELRIQIDSNIPKDNDDIEKIDFNIDVLYHPLKKEVKESLNALPFFTADMEYPSYLDTLPYDKILEFFFNKVVFMKILVKYGDKADATVNDKTDFEEKNLQKTFQLLFPTKYPVYQNHYNSHDYVIKETRPISNYMMNYANPFVKKYFSYVKHQGKIYTLSRVYWINDFLNHPITHDIFTQFRHVNHLFETDPSREQNEKTDDKSKQTKQSKQSKTEEVAEIQSKLNEEDSKIANFIQYLGKNERNASIRDFYRTLNRYRSTSQREQNIPYSFPIHNGLSKMIGSFLDLDKKAKKKEGEDQTNKNQTNEVDKTNKNEDNNDFIRFLFHVEEKYYKQNSENNEEGGNGDDKINNAMKVNFIYDNNNRNYRIVLLCEFFEGEVTDRNKSKVFCKYVDHKLGHLLEVLTEPAELREKFEWFLYSKRNALYSIDNKTIGRSVNRNVKFNRPNYTSQQQANVGKTDDNVNDLFKLPGLDIEDDENIKNLFKKYKELASATATEQYDFRVFVSNQIEKEIIQHMIDRNYRPTNDAIVEIDKLLSTIRVNKNSLQRKLDERQTRSNAYDQELKKVDMAILELKDAIYEKMYEYEKDNYYKYEN